MSNAFAAPLRLELRPSRQRRWLLLSVHLALLLPIPWLQHIGLQIGYVLIAFAGLYRHWHALLPSTLLWNSEGQWEIQLAAQVQPAQLAGVAFVQSWLVIVPLRVDNTRRVQRLAIFPDMLDAHSFRRLRVRLRQAHAMSPSA